MDLRKFTKRPFLGNSGHVDYSGPATIKGVCHDFVKIREAAKHLAAMNNACGKRVLDVANHTLSQRPFLCCCFVFNVLVTGSAGRYSFSLWRWNGGWPAGGNF
jgi:hypothetical protein